MAEKGTAANAMEARMEEKAKAKTVEEKTPVKATPTVKETKKDEKKTKGFAMELEDFGFIKYPLMTEKAITLIEKENKLSFITTEKATKTNIKALMEKVYNVKVVKVNVINDMKGKKKVTVKLDKKHKAEELAAKLGVI